MGLIVDRCGNNRIEWVEKKSDSNTIAQNVLVVIFWVFGYNNALPCKIALSCYSEQTPQDQYDVKISVWTTREHQGNHELRKEAKNNTQGESVSDGKSVHCHAKRNVEEAYGNECSDVEPVELVSI